MKKKYTVHKFGGSSLVDAESFRLVASRLRGSQEIIVVSAVQGVTSALQDLLETAAAGKDVLQPLNKIKTQHIDILVALFSSDQAELLAFELAKDIDAIASLLETTDLLHSYSSDLQAKVTGYGELWSAKILATLLSQNSNALFLDATQVLVTFHRYHTLTINWERSQLNWGRFISTNVFDQLVVTGFLAADDKGQQVTLGRNGSDFSAAIFAKLAKAASLVIWKDVGGVLSADPARVPTAFPIPHLSYKAAMELAYFGGAVIHPQTIAPAMAADIPIVIKSTFDPKAPGTQITSAGDTNLLVQGISSIDDVALITLEGAGLIGVSGTAVRVFQALQHLDISVILISQASSEHSICFAVAAASADQAVTALEEAFAFELLQKIIERVYVDKEVSILSIVGDGMVHHVGVAAKFTSTLASANINIRAIAQGASERSISLVVAKTDINKALRIVHSGFYLSQKTLSIGIIGPGLVGATLLAQIASQQATLEDKLGVKLLVRGICNSKKMLLSQSGIDLTKWQSLFDTCDVPVDLDVFCDTILSDDMPHGVIIDCTATSIVSDRYISFAEKGAHLITPNKRANASQYDYYERLMQTVADKNRYYFYESTVCAGLPVLTTLHDLIQTGDEIIKIEGVVSGTLSYLFNELVKGLAFSEVIKQAKALGYTEPDPREDLSGMDVARKIVILARELGHAVNLEDIDMPVLLPQALLSCDVDCFMETLPEYDEQIRSAIWAQVKPGEKPAFVASVNDQGNIFVGVVSIGASHPLSRLDGTDNMLIFHTQRYNDLPLVVQGPGAGAQVTAAGVFADLLRLSSCVNN